MDTTSEATEGTTTVIRREVYQRAHSMDKPAGGSLAPNRCGHTRRLTDRPRHQLEGAGISRPPTGFALRRSVNET